LNPENSRAKEIDSMDISKLIPDFFARKLWANTGLKSGWEGLTLKLRAHHLLCIHGFRGLGYTSAFVDTLRRTIQIIKANENLLIELTNECDILCFACPHKLGNKCVKDGFSCEKKVRELDGEVLSCLGLKPGSTISVKALLPLIQRKIDEKDLERMCGGCEWFDLGYCREGLTRGLLQ